MKFAGKGFLVVALSLLLFGARAYAVLIDDFSSNGTNGSTKSISISPSSPGPTNFVYTGLGATAIGNRTTTLFATSGVPPAGEAFIETKEGSGTAAVYNYGSSSFASTHQISWALTNFDLLSAVGVATPGEISFKLSFEVGNSFMYTPTQTFGVRVAGTGGEGFYSAVVSSNDIGSLEFTLLSFSSQSGSFDATSVTNIQFTTDLPFAGSVTQFEFTEVSAVPEPSTAALLGLAAAAVSFVVLRRRG